MKELKNLKLGYVPMSAEFTAPGDRRRFVFFARTRGLSFEIADPRKSYDVVVLSERADISVWSRYRGGKVVYDFIDSYLAVPRTEIKGLLRGIAKFITRQNRFLNLNYWKLLEKMCRRADAVICSTEEQRQTIGQFCSNVHMILDAHGFVARQKKTDYQSGKSFRIVWEGQPPTLGFLEPLAPALRSLSKQVPIELHLITNPYYYPHLDAYGKQSTERLARKIFENVVLHRWTEEDCTNIVCACDLAVVPLSLSDPFVSGKPENRLLLFWSMAMPVLASATPAHQRVMDAAGLSMTCQSPDDWNSSLTRYVFNASARRTAGEAGYRYAMAHHTDEMVLAAWDRLMDSLRNSL